MVSKTKKRATKTKSSKSNIKKNKSNKKDSKPSSLTYIISTFILLFAIVALWLFFSQGVINKTIVKEGDVISVWYIGTLVDGEVFDTNVEEIAVNNDLDKPIYEPLSFVVAGGQMIKGFDEAVVGMKVGETKVIEIKPEDAYGAYKAELVRSVTFEEFEESFFPIENATEGMLIPVRFANGALGNIKVDTIGTNFVKLDMNHPLAGKKLIFEIEIESINNEN